MEMIKEYISKTINENRDENGKLNEFAVLVVVFATISLLSCISKE